MSNERCMVLLNNVINDISVCNTNRTTIQKLLHLGFLANELTKDFGFSMDDVLDAADGMESFVAGEF